MSAFTSVVIDESELDNGYSAFDIFSNSEYMGITFDDLIALPGHIDFGVELVELETNFTRNIKLKYPLCSSPMDTVTEDAMAIGMAQNGGIGIIHGNCDVETQCAMVRKVKLYESGFIMEPAVLSPNDIVSDLDELRRNRRISGVPVTVDGEMTSKLVGLISNRDTDFLEDRSRKISELMTPLSQLVTGQYPISIEEANKILKDSKKGYLPLVDESGNLRALTTRSDLKKNKVYPMASKDQNGKLLVGASIFSGPQDEIDMYRVDCLYEAGVNVIVLDSINGDCDNQVEFIKAIKTAHPDLDVIAGNVVRASQARRLLEAGADALRVGMGVGSIATTQIVNAVGRAQLTSIHACARLAKEFGVPVIADGGIKNTGCIIKALSIGANVVMMGHLLAGVDESPGEYFFQNGVRLKHYRPTVNSLSTQGNIMPMDSSTTGFNSPARGGGGLVRKAAGLKMQSPDSPSRHIKSKHSSALPSGPSVTEFPLPPTGVGATGAGVAASVVDKGPINRYLPYLVQSIRHGMQDMGVRSLSDMHQQMYDNKLRFELRSASAQKEGGVHDLHSFTQVLYA